MLLSSSKQQATPRNKCNTGHWQKLNQHGDDAQTTTSTTKQTTTRSERTTNCVDEINHRAECNYEERSNWKEEQQEIIKRRNYCEVGGARDRWQPTGTRSIKAPGECKRPEEINLIGSEEKMVSLKQQRRQRCDDATSDASAALGANKQNNNNNNHDYKSGAEEPDDDDGDDGEQQNDIGDCERQRPSLGQLTELRWQPPTDANKYADLLYNRRKQNYLDNHHGKTTTQYNINESSFDNHYADLINAKAAAATAYRCRQSPHLACPELVRHEPVSNLQRRFKELARVRRRRSRSSRRTELEETRREYSAIDPEAEKRRLNFEEAIEQLEETNQLFQDDDSLLDRAEVRDWPEEYFQRFPTPSSSASDQQHDSANSKLQDHHHHQNFNHLKEQNCEKNDQIWNDEDRRNWNEINSLEQREIDSAHQRRTTRKPQIIAADNETSADAAAPMYRTLPSPLPDRYEDDLAYRKWHKQTESPAGVVSINSTKHHKFNDARQSYLLCAGAPTTPTMRSPNYHDYATDLVRPHVSAANLDDNDRLNFEPDLDWRLRYDDLHFRRSVARKPEAHEPPFGIPRQASSGVHSTASHYYGRVSSPTSNQAACRASGARLAGNELPVVDNSNSTSHRRTEPKNLTQRTTIRTESRVSFHEERHEYLATNDYQNLPRKFNEREVAPAAHRNFQPPPPPQVGRHSADSGFGVMSNLTSNGQPSSSLSPDVATQDMRNQQQHSTYQLTAKSPLTTSVMDKNRLLGESSPAPLAVQTGSLSQFWREHDDDERDQEDEVAVDNDYEHSEISEPTTTATSTFERHRARYREQPSRSRPLIPLENPRSKSPLLRCSPNPTTQTKQNSAARLKQTDLVTMNHSQRECKPLVQVQTYESSTLTRDLNRRRNRKLKDTGSRQFAQREPLYVTDDSSLIRGDNGDELECRFDFEDDQLDQNYAHQNYDGFNQLERLYVPANGFNSFGSYYGSSTTMDNRNDERFSKNHQDEDQQGKEKQFRSSSRASQYDEDAADYLARLSMAEPRSPSAASFSIGSYKSTDKKTNLRIL